MKKEQLHNTMNDAAKLVVYFLGLSLLGAEGVVLICLLKDKTTPNEIWIFMSAIIAALPSLLARVGKDSTNDNKGTDENPLKVQAPTDETLPVTETK